MTMEFIASGYRARLSKVKKDRIQCWGGGGETDCNGIYLHEQTIEQTYTETTANIAGVREGG